MSTLPTLYQLTDDLQQLMEADAEDEVSAALIELVSCEIEKKSEGICKLVKVLETTAEQFKAEEKRIADRRKAMESKAARIREFMRDRLLAADITKLDAGTFKVSIGTVGSCAIDDIEAIPARYKTVVQTVTVDKNMIKKAIKEGETVPGAHIEAGYSMTIR